MAQIKKFSSIQHNLHQTAQKDKIQKKNYIFIFRVLARKVSSLEEYLITTKPQLHNYPSFYGNHQFNTNDNHNSTLRKYTRAKTKNPTSNKIQTFPFSFPTSISSEHSILQFHTLINPASAEISVRFHHHWENCMFSKLTTQSYSS